MPGSARPRRFGTAASALLGMLAVAVLAGVMVAVAVTPAIALTGTTASGGIDAFNDLPSDLTIGSLDQKTELYAKDGDKEVRIASFYAQDREVVGWDDISDAAKNAAIAGEDVRFYDHGAVDPVGVVRATLGNLAGKDLQGASTITQQYVKNVCVQEAENEATTKQVDAAYKVCTDTTIGRKLREARLAVAVEKKYSKQQILLGYLNIAGFGGRVYGIEAAAKYYFDTSAKDLTVAQAASLMAIVNDPASLKLDDKANYDRNKDRRDYILGVELRNKLIDQADYDKAVATKIDPDITPADSGCAAAGDAAFFCDYVKNIVLTDDAFGKDSATRAANLQRSGYRIYTTLDLKAQKAATEAEHDWVPKSASFDVGSTNDSIEVGTGRVLTMTQNKDYVAGASTSSGSTSVNYSAGPPLSTSGGFQPGSTFKLFTLLDWLKTGHTLNETVDANAGTRAASDFTACGKTYEGEDWHLANDEGETGTRTVLDATARSVNGAFASMAQQLDLCDIRDLSQSFGVLPTNAPENGPIYLPFVIGGSYGVAPLAETNAYATVANHGKYCKPIAIDKVTDANGKALPVPKADCKQVIDPAVADAAVYALHTVITGSGTAGADSTPDGLYEFGKTGTTDDAKQVWMIGSTSKVTTGVWVGNVKGDQGLRLTSFPNPCYTSGGGLASDARHCVWKQTQTALNDTYGGATSWEQPESQYLYGGGPVQEDAQQQTEAGTVPDVTGQSKAAASQALVAAGYSWAYGSDTGNGDSDVVDSTEPAAGASAEPHSQVVIHGGG